MAALSGDPQHDGKKKKQRNTLWKRSRKRNENQILFVV